MDFLKVFLLCNNLVEDLEACIFKINPYDPCVVNNIINGKKVTVTFHVDDLKVSHQDKFEISKFETYLSGICGKKLILHRGKVHDFLVIDLEYYG